MIKQIYMPVSSKTTQTEMMVSPERVQQRRKDMNTRVLKAESELDAALNEGYVIKAQYPSDDAEEIGIVFVLHKPDEGADKTRGAMSKKYIPHPDSPHR